MARHSRHAGRISVYSKVQHPQVPPRKVSKKFAMQLVQQALAQPIANGLQLLVSDSVASIKARLANKRRETYSFDLRNSGQVCSQVAVARSTKILAGGLVRGETTPRRALRATH